VHRGAADRSRASLKPEIPPAGAYGIPLRDEIELEDHPEQERRPGKGAVLASVGR
jgi:hypothetical protein